MPTPFYHLSLAEELLSHPGLPAAHLLRAEQPAFLLGSTAPDVQVVSGQRRVLTHFFQVPPADATWPVERMLDEYPGLRKVESMPPGQAAFLAGYITHLVADFEWIRTIFLPIFGVEADWETFPHRLYIHNVVRTWLDEEVLTALPTDEGERLSTAVPAQWLPFVEDHFLRQWRDYIQEQLQPGAAIHTVEVFARRQGLAPEEFIALLRSTRRMDEEVFSRVSRQELIEYRQRTVTACLDWLTRTLTAA